MTERSDFISLLVTMAFLHSVKHVTDAKIKTKLVNSELDVSCVALLIPRASR